MVDEFLSILTACDLEVDADSMTFFIDYAYERFLIVDYVEFSGQKYPPRYIVAHIESWGHGSESEWCISSVYEECAQDYVGEIRTFYSKRDGFVNNVSWVDYSK